MVERSLTQRHNLDRTADLDSAAPLPQGLDVIETDLAHALRAYELPKALPEKYRHRWPWRLPIITKFILRLLEKITRRVRRGGLIHVNAQMAFLNSYRQEHAAQHMELAKVREEVAQLRRRIVDFESQLDRIDSKRQDAPPLPFQTDLDTQTAHDYIEFEDHFRGDESHIQAQLKADYLPVLIARGINAGARGVDIGCGRGEWLSLMVSHGYLIEGVDINQTACSRCLARGLPVHSGDGIAYLTQLEPASLDFVSAFHVIEHLSAPHFVQLVRAAHRALRPGGLLIVETPNPEHLLVGSCNFYNDPTHLRPLPPEPTRFRLVQQGFKDVEIIRLHPSVSAAALPEGHGLPAALEACILTGQDYALIATRPCESTQETTT